MPCLWFQQLGAIHILHVHASGKDLLANHVQDNG
jgi:hypothetical protein